MAGLTQEAEQIMSERFGKDTVITYGLPNKMRQIEKNPQIAGKLRKAV